MFNYVRQAEVSDCEALAPKIKQEDIEEIKASDNVTPLEGLLMPFEIEGHKTYSMIGTKEEGIIGMFGTVPSSDNPDYGIIWMLGSDLITNHTKQFLRECPKWIAEASKDYKYVFNFVDIRNQTSRVWLRWLGFKEIRLVNNYGYAQLPFIQFMKEIK